MKMKQLISIGLLSFAISGTALAMHHEEGEERDGGRQLEKMAEHLQLSDQQKAAVASIMQEQNDKRKTLQQNMQTQRAQLQAETRARMSEVLSPEQLKKMDSMREERQEKRHEKMEKWKEKREKHKDRY